MFYDDADRGLLVRKSYTNPLGWLPRSDIQDCVHSSATVSVGTALGREAVRSNKKQYLFDHPQSKLGQPIFVDWVIEDDEYNRSYDCGLAAG